MSPRKARKVAVLEAEARGEDNAIAHVADVPAAAAEVVAGSDRAAFAWADLGNTRR